MHLFVAAGRMFEAAAACGRGHPGIGEHTPLAAQYPSLGALAAGFDSRDTVAHMGWCAAGPHLRRLGYMCVGVNDGVSTHDCPPWFVPTGRSFNRNLNRRPISTLRASALCRFPA